MIRLPRMMYLEHLRALISGTKTASGISYRNARSTTISTRQYKFTKMIGSLIATRGAEGSISQKPFLTSEEIEEGGVYPIPRIERENK